MGPKKQSRSAACRLAGSSLVLLVVAGVIAVSVARTWAQPLPPCKTPQVIQEINRLKTEVATQKEIVDRAEKAWDDAGKAWDACPRPAHGTNPECAALAQRTFQARIDYEKAEAQYHDLSVRLEALERLPNCPEVPQTPPPPPPPPPSSPPSGGQGGTTGPVQPDVPATHRETSCAACKELAAKLNNTIDNYNAAIRNGTMDLPLMRFEMQEYLRELDECEKQCAKPKPDQGATPQTGGTPSHRQTSCQVCQPLAAKLNEAVDNYVKFRSQSNKYQTEFWQHAMQSYSLGLDDCEKTCQTQQVPRPPYVEPPSPLGPAPNKNPTPR